MARRSPFAIRPMRTSSDVDCMPDGRLVRLVAGKRDQVQCYGWKPLDLRSHSGVSGMVAGSPDAAASIAHRSEICKKTRNFMLLEGTSDARPASSTDPERGVQFPQRGQHR